MYVVTVLLHSSLSSSQTLLTPPYLVFISFFDNLSSVCDVYLLMSVVPSTREWLTYQR